MAIRSMPPRARLSDRHRVAAHGHHGQPDVIVGVMVLGPLRFRALRKCGETHLLNFRAFARSVVNDAAGAWVGRSRA